MRVYLAGAITEYANRGEFDRACEWRREVARLLRERDPRIDIYDPTADTAADQYLAANMDTARTSSIVNANMLHLAVSDVIILDTRYLLQSPGTMFELYYAKFNKIPVVAITSDDVENIMKYPHLRFCLERLVDTPEQAVDTAFRIDKCASCMYKKQFYDAIDTIFCC